MKVAGNTTEFVNKILEKMKQGVANGGLDDIHHSNWIPTSLVNAHIFFLVHNRSYLTRFNSFRRTVVSPYQ